MRLQLGNAEFTKNFEFHARLTRKCIVCDSNKIKTNQSRIHCKCCDSFWSFE